MRIGNAFSNIKLVFFVLFLVLFVGFAARDIRAGDASSPTWFLGFLVVIALVFKPWRTASDEQSKPPRKPGAFLMAPLFMQQITASSPTCEGWWDCYRGVSIGLLLFVAAIIGVILWRTRKRDTAPRTARYHR